MARIVISENLSIDGVIHDPTGEEGRPFGGWFAKISDRDREAWANVETQDALAAEAVLLGRRSYEFFAGRWPTRTGPWAERLNSMPKYVVSSTLTDPKWNNTHVLGNDVVDEVSKLKEQFDGDIVVYASAQLVPTLMEHDLVDELRLMVYPFVFGAGRSVFGETNDMKAMRLVHLEAVGENLALLTYQPMA